MYDVSITTSVRAGTSTSILTPTMSYSPPAHQLLSIPIIYLSGIRLSWQVEGCGLHIGCTYDGRVIGQGKTIISAAIVNTEKTMRRTAAMMLHYFIGNH